MKDYKNNYVNAGYLNEQKKHRKSRLILHEYSDLPEVYYQDDKDLSKHL